MTKSKIFNYEGRMNIFSRIKCPILVIFGENDAFANNINAKQSLQKLREKTNYLIKAKHEKEKEVIRHRIIFYAR